MSLDMSGVNKGEANYTTMMTGNVNYSKAPTPNPTAFQQPEERIPQVEEPSTSPSNTFYIGSATEREFEISTTRQEYFSESYQEYPKNITNTQTRNRSQTMSTVGKETIGRGYGLLIGPTFKEKTLYARDIADSCSKFIGDFESQEKSKQDEVQLTYSSLVGLKEGLRELVNKIDQVALERGMSPLLKQEFKGNANPMQRSSSTQNVKTRFFRKSSGSKINGNFGRTNSFNKNFLNGTDVALILDPVKNPTAKLKADLIVEECRKIKNLCFEELPFAKISTIPRKWVKDYSEEHFLKMRDCSRRMLELFNLLLSQARFEPISMEGTDRDIISEEFKHYLSAKKFQLNLDSDLSLCKSQVEKFLKEKVLAVLSEPICSKVNQSHLKKWLPPSNNSEILDSELDGIGPLAFHQKYGIKSLCETANFLLSKKDLTSHTYEWSRYERRKTKLQTEFYLYDSYHHELMTFLDALSGGEVEVHELERSERNNKWINELTEIIQKKLGKEKMSTMLSHVANAIKKDYLPQLQQLRDSKLRTLIDSGKKIDDETQVVYRQKDVGANNWKVMIKGIISAAQVEDWERDLMTGIFQMYASDGRPLLKLVPLEKITDRIHYLNSLMGQIEEVISENFFFDDKKKLITAFREAAIQELEEQAIIEKNLSNSYLKQHLQIFLTLNPLLIKLLNNELEEGHLLIQGIEKRLRKMVKLPPDVNVLTILQYLKVFYQALLQSIENSGSMALRTLYSFAYRGDLAIQSSPDKEWDKRKIEAHFTGKGDIEFRFCHKEIIDHPNFPIIQDATIIVPGLSSGDVEGKSSLKFHSRRLGEIPPELKTKVKASEKRVEYLIANMEASWDKVSAFNPFKSPYSIENTDPLINLDNNSIQ